MGKLIDLIGQKFGRLTVIERVVNKRHRVAWLCRCSCGNEAAILSDSLRSGRTKSCGCLSREKSADMFLRHGHTRGHTLSSTYRAWAGLLQRCNNKNNHAYSYYGRRGIKVCKRWVNSFESFLADMGKRPEGLTLDRIDNSKGYNKANCRWATWDVQNNNRRPKNPQRNLFPLRVLYAL